MHIKLLVREVRLAGGCFSRRDFAPDVAPDLVCPLCVVEGKRHDNERTATLGNSGHIWCFAGCGRYSAIITRSARDGEISVYPCDLRQARHLEPQTQALSVLRPALHGEGDLLDMLALDDLVPQATVGFVLAKLKLDQRALMTESPDLVEVMSGQPA